MAARAPSRVEEHRKERKRARFAFSLVALAVAFALAIPGCTRSERTSSAQDDRLVIFAASSLREAFSMVAADFRGAHPGVEITFNFAGTQELRTQLEHGAVADLLASADPTHMDALVRASMADSPVVFAHNEPVIVVAKESARTLRNIVDLPNASRIVLGTPDVPIGRYTLEILNRATATLGPDFRARVEAKVISREPNVRQVLGKVSLGEAQAGIVYRTDARSARDTVSVVAIPREVNVVATYPVAVLKGAPHPRLARAWIDFLLSPEGQRVLVSAGFTLPPRIGSP
jgi:molybdate transport system substrate-binding protein